jgi:hypothetical protein
VHSENCLTAGLVRWLQHDPPIKPSWSQQGGVEYVRPVGGSQDNHAFLRREAIHFGQDLIQRLLLFGVRAAINGIASRAADGIQLVDEHDGRCSLPGLLEEIAHAARSDANDHLDELTGAHTEERHTGFAGDCPSQQRLARTGRPHQEDAFWRGATQARVARRLFQEVNDLN